MRLLIEVDSIEILNEQFQLKVYWQTRNVSNVSFDDNDDNREIDNHSISSIRIRINAKWSEQIRTIFSKNRDKLWGDLQNHFENNQYLLSSCDN